MYKKMHRLEFLVELETRVSEVIKRTYQSRWDENFISGSIAHLFAKEFAEIEIDSFPTKIKSCAYENKKGNHEYKYGDICFYVKIQYSDPKLNIEGVSFLEAKRSYPDKSEENRFNEIKLCQAKRIFENAPFSFLLLYDHEPIKINKNDWFIYNYVGYSCICSPFVSHSHCAVLPLNIVNQIKIKSRELFRFASLFSEQVIFRFFNGDDLNFDGGLLKLAKGYRDESDERLSEFQMPTFLIPISISYSEEEPQEIEINREIYTPVSSNS
jgi:hypothetical protein